MHLYATARCLYLLMMVMIVNIVAVFVKKEKKKLSIIIAKRVNSVRHVHWATRKIYKSRR